MNLLIAYPYFKKNTAEWMRLLNTLDPDDYRLIIDSGAFSAYNSGHEVTLDGYCSFLKAIEYSRFERAVQLDVVFKPEETKLNLDIMRDRGFNVSPVFTRGDDFNYFDELLTRDEYVFVGGVQSQGKGNSEPLRFANECLKRSKGKKVHYLAFIRPDYLIYYKPYSVDASSWSSSAQFGNLMLYDGNGRMRSFDRSHFKTFPKPEIISLMRSLKIEMDEIKELQKLDKWRNKGLSRLDNPDRFTGNIFYSILAFLKYSIDAQNKIGTRIYNAIGHAWQLDLFIHAHRHLKERQVI
jgi:hypothetical protein